MRAGIHVKINGFHRMLTRRTPFAPYSLVEESCISNYAILACLRDPLWIRSRLPADQPLLALPSQAT